MGRERSLAVAFSHFYLVTLFVVGNSFLAVLNHDILSIIKFLALSGQPLGDAKTVMVEVPGTRIDAHRKGHRKQTTDATYGQIAEHLASDAALHLLLRLEHPDIGEIDTAALSGRPAWTAVRPPDFTYDGMNAWEA
jgi:hypothetical protein